MRRALHVLRNSSVIGLALGMLVLRGCGGPAPPRVANPTRSPTPPVRVPTSDGPTNPTAHFATLPVGATLPTDASCAAQVRSVPELRPANASFNARTGSGPLQTGFYARVTGNFTGTTDEIIQWAACKWGIDEDIVRAQTAKESGWYQQNGGDFTGDPSRCVPNHPIGVDGRAGQCPESIGLMQVRYPYWSAAFPMATDSSAYNLDEALAARRSCFEGNEAWLNQYERGQQYAAGDIWGCVGLWFAGRWHTADANTYTAAVQDYYNRRIWETPGFASWNP